MIRDGIHESSLFGLVSGGGNLAVCSFPLRSRVAGLIWANLWTVLVDEGEHTHMYTKRKHPRCEWDRIRIFDRNDSHKQGGCGRVPLQARQLDFSCNQTPPLPLHPIHEPQSREQQEPASVVIMNGSAALLIVSSFIPFFDFPLGNPRLV
ncbi:hypothetical protein IE53DRAFT_144470 [Violaceomyces palustris]|uniref:Uncharacterized protein n=1 Tax=Violaceomyces palustris TaxID=1673888 RepID=A0ACD0NUI9_9BASI|nr:hypothetical protein IE53DRAFT_144470 [Violaceomyces palustris]